MTSDRRQRRADRLTTVLLCALATAVLGLGILATVSSRNANRLDVQQAALNRQERIEALAISGGCARLQVVRDEINQHSWAIYRATTLAAANAAHAGQSKAADFWRDIAGTVKYLPPTNCAEAVVHPGSYLPPEPVPFYTVASCFSAVNLRPPLNCGAAAPIHPL